VTPFCFSGTDVPFGVRTVTHGRSQNDIHLVDLLFKAHLEKGTAFEIEIIAGEKVGAGIRDNYGFFPALRTLTSIRSDYSFFPRASTKTKDNLVPEEEPANPFKTWLKYKSLALLGAKKAERTRHVKKVVK
jgi:hypothetical protein